MSNTKILFNRPCSTGLEDKYVNEVMKSNRMAGDGNFTKKCQKIFETTLNCKKALLTTSCTHALEIAAILIGIKPGDEVIMPSYTFVSTANAFVLRGAKIIFVDIRPDTLNIDENKLECAINAKTKAIVPVHYGGVGCEMDTILKIAQDNNLYVIEDAAQGMLASYKNRQLGTLGNLGTYSFHDTKNFTSGGEGGLLIINDEAFIERSEIIREKGTNRSRFIEGLVDKYSWVDIGSSYLLSELNAAYLFGQLQVAEKINEYRLKSWEMYFYELSELEKKGYIKLMNIPRHCKHNAHMFYIKVKNIKQRIDLIEHLNSNGINATFHYIPLHNSIAGKVYGKFHGIDEFTTNESNKIIRLPLYYGITKEEIKTVVSAIYKYWQ